MNTEKLAALQEIIAHFPSLGKIIETVIGVWPDHTGYALKSMKARSPTVLAASETAAARALLLAGNDLRQFASDYRWTCSNFREEELFFFREDRYRLSTFKEAFDKIYSNATYMERYMNGLLISNIMWSNHASIFEMFINRVIGSLVTPIDYLEVGPGHGLMLSFAAGSPAIRSLEAWDVSDTSLRATRSALDRLAVCKPVKLDCVDIVKARDSGRKFDLIVFSEILEHLETPRAALAGLRSAVRDNGRVFINVPLNSPAPDHIYLLSEPEEVRSVIESEGFQVETMELYATQGTPIERALEDKITISAGVVARPC